jgi:hypothetical protein
VELSSGSTNQIEEEELMGPVDFLQLKLGAFRGEADQTQTEIAGMLWPRTPERIRTSAKRIMQKK